MQTFLGIEYGHGCLKNIIGGGPALAPRTIQSMFPDANWKFVTTTVSNTDKWTFKSDTRDRFGENFEIQNEIYKRTNELYQKGRGHRHIMVGGDHSTNFGHFAAVADNTDGDLCLVYIDAHYDIHNPESAAAEASGAPHGTNVRALLGDGDARWLSLQRKIPALKVENLFYLGTRSFEPSEKKFIDENNIFNRNPEQLKTHEDWTNAVLQIRKQINGRPFVLSVDFDSIDPSVFRDVLVPAGNGISLDAAKFFISSFKDAVSFEFVEYAPSGDDKSASIVRDLISIVFNG